METYFRSYLSKILKEQLPWMNHFILLFILPCTVNVTFKQHYIVNTTNITFVTSIKM